MRTTGLLILFLFSFIPMLGQDTTRTSQGTVSYVTAQSIYVKFNSTEAIRKGDTLFISRNGNQVPALVVRDLSSISCVCIPLPGITLKTGENLLHRSVVMKKQEPAPVPVPVSPAVEMPLPVLSTDSAANAPPKATPVKQRIRGHMTLGSWSDFSTLSDGNSQRLRYTFSLDARNIGNTNLSADCYFSYVYTDSNRDEIRNDIFNGLKVYSFAFGYDFGKRASVWFGRKINPKISNMGTVDGLQAEVRFKPFSVGVLAGFRPDFKNYGFNSSLFQAGGYAGHEVMTKIGMIQTTLAFIEQQNSGHTDRRFLYLQHGNAVVKNLYFFGSAEVDLYKKEFNSTDSTLSASSKPWLSNLYLSLSYRAFRKLYLSASYSARQNVIYYETYKTFLEKILDDQTLQGFTFQASYRPWTRFTVGLTAGYRFRQNDPRPSENLYLYATYSQLPGIGINVTGSFVVLQSVYLTGKIYSIGINRDFARGKLNAGLNYRYVDYLYSGTEYTLAQNIGEASVTWRIIRKLGLSVYYEGTFEKTENFTRIFAQLNLNF